MAAPRPARVPRPAARTQHGAQLASVYRYMAEMERQFDPAGRPSQLAFVYRYAAEMERQFDPAGRPSQLAFVCRYAAEMERQLLGVEAA